MKREILFRGKVKYNGNYLFAGDWVYGSLIIRPRATFIYVIEEDSYGNIVRNFEVEVMPETIAQFTGLTDKKRVKIFDGDILLSESWCSNSRCKRRCHIVEWEKIGWIASGYNGDMTVKPSLDVKSDWQVIGNIHDNPELLK